MSWTSGLNMGGVGALLPQVKPWQRFDWKSCLRSKILRDWGSHYLRRSLNQTALKSMQRALETCKVPDIRGQLGSCTLTRPTTPKSIRNCMDPDHLICSSDYKILYQRSRCHRSMANSKRAVEDAQLAQRTIPMAMGRHNSVPGTADIVQEKCNALLDANAFERSLVTVYDEGRDFHSKNSERQFHKIQEKIMGIFNDTVGDSLSPFFIKNMAAIEGVIREREEAAANIPRPLWKIRRDRPECDVQSIEEKKSIQLTPIERARRKNSERLYTYNYMRRNAVDVALLRELRTNENFLNPLMGSSTPHLRQLTRDQFDIIGRFLKMMHARNPLYNRTFIRNSGDIGERSQRRRREAHLFHLEYQTRRDCFRMLRQVRALRRAGNVDKMSDYVEHIMSNNIELKTHRTLPWKWEFLNEVYNLMGLAHTDRCSVPANVDFLQPKNRFLLFLIPPEKKVKEISDPFGGTNMYVEMHQEEERHNRINQKLEHLENRLRYSPYAIERSYLLFEMARWHFRESRFDKCLVVAQRAFEEARTCKSLIWRFNSIFLACQVHAVLSRYERLKETLAKAEKLASALRAPKLHAYLSICITINDYDMALRKLRQSDVSLRKSRKKSNHESRTAVSAAVSVNVSSESLVS
nr:uncharacterized protein LOC108131907 [Drosophila bipectinata]